MTQPDPTGTHRLTIDCADVARDDGWFAVQIKPNGLALAQRNLARQGFAVFAPMRRGSGKPRTPRLKPLFPGYVFTQFEPRSSDWYRINSTRGVLRLIVGPERPPRALPDAFIAALRARCEEDGTVVAGPDLSRGDTVEVVAGPFADLVSTVEALDADGRLQLLVELMGRMVRVSVPRAQVEKRSETM